MSVCICVDQRFLDWQRCSTVSHRQPFRNVPQPRDGLWSLISRAPACHALSANVRHSSSQMHAGGAAASCESFPVFGVLACFSDYLYGNLSISYFKSVFCMSVFLSIYFKDKHFKLLRPQIHAIWLHCVNTVSDWIPPTPLSSTSHVCHSEEPQCGFKGHISMPRFTLFTINPTMLPSVFTVQWRNGSGKGNIKQSELYNDEQTLLTYLGMSSNKWQT